MAEIRSVPRRNHPMALALFLAAYLSALALIFAPQGTFSPEPPVRQASAGLFP
jgi:hypothetical protein